MADKEIWKDIEGYEGKYQVSNMGRVRSLKKWVPNGERFVENVTIMEPQLGTNGYLNVYLSMHQKKKRFYIHRLVAMAFLEKPEGCNCVNHLDYDFTNNEATNLEWCTQGDNVRYSAHRMRHRKSKAYSNTGEQYIYFSKGKYRVCVDHKEYPKCKTLEEAIKERDAVLRGEYGRQERV